MPMMPSRKLRYFECDGHPYIYDPATTKLFLATADERTEISDRKQRGQILLNSVSISEGEFYKALEKRAGRRAL